MTYEVPLRNVDDRRIGHRATFIFVLALAAAGSFACRRADAPPRAPSAPSAPIQTTHNFRIVSPTAGKLQRFLLTTTAGPVTVVSTGGIQRGSNLRLELITPVELTLEPGTVDVTVVAIGDSGVQLRAFEPDGLSAESAKIEISSHSIFPAGCCPLPKGFKLDDSRP